MNFDSESSRIVYARLQDDYSRFIYEKRAMYCITMDNRFMTELGESVLDRKILSDLMKDMEKVKDKLVVRGAGNDYWVIRRMFPEFEFVLFVDNDPTKIGKRIDNKEVISPAEFYDKYSDHYVLVNSAAANQEIISELKSHGIRDERIFNLSDSYAGMCDKQYFEEDIIRPEPGEVFVDGGSYDGRTIKQFIKWCGGDYKKIYAFEPDGKNCSWLKSNLLEAFGGRSFCTEGVTAGRADVTLQGTAGGLINIYNRGLWDHQCEISFAENGSQASKISESGSNVIKTITVDEVTAGEKVTFLKLDVEGAEYKALLGAKETIRNHHPKMAISIYHKPQDIFELPELILSLCQEYRFYLRHYQLGPFETILYCL